MADPVNLEHLEPTVPELAFTFESQARQFPKTGKPGIEHVRSVVACTVITHKLTGGQIPITTDRPIDVLLERNRKGHVVGILFYYAEGAEPWERPGAVNVYVRPDRQRRGIGTRLLRAALHRWPIDLADQSYTKGGLALSRSVLDSVDRDDRLVTWEKASPEPPVKEHSP